MGSEALNRIASLSKLYASYGVNIAEAYIIVAMQKFKQDVTSSPVMMHGGGAAQADAETALGWLLRAFGLPVQSLQVGKFPENCVAWCGSNNLSESESVGGDERKCKEREASP